MNIIIFGPQGSGKGTQAELLVKKYDLYYFEAGKILRELAKDDSRLDEKINQEGVLLPDTLTNGLFKKYLDENVAKSDGLLFDGYPRSVNQYRFLQEWLGTKGGKIDFAILLNVSEEVSIKRLSARRICVNCGRVYNLITNPPSGEKCVCGGELMQRKDDQPEAIKERLSAYKKRTKPLVEVFKEDGILVEVNGDRPIDVIFSDTTSHIEEKNDDK